MQAMIRYKVKPERVDENVQLVQAVYDQLQELQPDGLRWATFQLPDNVSFVDLVIGPDLPHPLPGLETFQRYRARLDDRCDEMPVMTELAEIGSFRIP